MTPEQPRTAAEVVALLREYEAWNGEKNYDVVLRREWMAGLSLLRDELVAALVALRSRDERVIGEAVERLSGVLGG